MFKAVALWADGNTAIGADPDGGANAPNIRPPRTPGDGGQDGAVFLLGAVPGLLWSHAQFAMSFPSVAMKAQSVDVGVGDAASKAGTSYLFCIMSVQSQANQAIAKATSGSLVVNTASSVQPSTE